MKTMSSGAGAMFMKEELRSRSCIIFVTAPQPCGWKQANWKHLALDSLPPINVLGWKVGEVVSVHQFWKVKYLSLQCQQCLDSHGRPQKFFQGGNIDILLILFRLLTMQRKCTFTKRFALSTPQRKGPILRKKSQKCVRRQAIAKLGIWKDFFRGDRPEPYQPPSAVYPQLGRFTLSHGARNSVLPPRGDFAGLAHQTKFQTPKLEH